MTYRSRNANFRKRRQAVCLALSVAAAVAVPPYAGAVEPGHYVFVEGGTAGGSLDIKGATFDINTVGANGHTCGASGTLKGNTGTVSDSGEGVCHFTLKDDHGGLRLTYGNFEACHSNCGMRAGFEGLYRRPPVTCTDHAQSARLKQARGEYMRHAYADARVTYAALLDQCATFMDWIAVDGLRSELALTQFHLGEPGKCLATLAPTLAVRMGTENSIVLPPVDAMSYESTGKAILHNKALCLEAEPANQSGVIR